MAVATRHNCIKQTHCNLTDFTFKRGKILTIMSVCCWHNRAQC